MKPEPTQAAIPRPFLVWMADSRLKILDDLDLGRPVDSFSAHLPVVATWNADESFPVNMTVKGIGLVPASDRLGEYTDLFETAYGEAGKGDWKDSASLRIGALRRLYGNVKNFDPTLLGGLEIFEGRAFRNLSDNPRASLLYAGVIETARGLSYISFQINGLVEVLTKENPHYRFLLASRRIFERDRFHLHQPDYPWGYLIRVQEVRDKSPRTRNG